MQDSNFYLFLYCLKPTFEFSLLYLTNQQPFPGGTGYYGRTTKCSRHGWLRVVCLAAPALFLIF